MTHSVSQRLAGDLRIHSSGIHSPTKANDTPHALFRSAVLNGLDARMQACSDDITHDALRQIADAFGQNKDITLPKNVSGTDTDGMPDEKAVNRFITGLIQSRVHELDRKISHSLHNPEISAGWSRSLMCKAQAESRMAPLLAVYERAADSSFLKTCLGEDLSAIKQPPSIDDKALLKYYLPEAINQLEKQMNEFRELQTRNDSRRYDAFLQGMQSLVSAAIQANSSRIEQLSIGHGAFEEQHIQRLETYFEKLAVLDKAFQDEFAALQGLAEQLDGEKYVEALPAGLGTAAELFLSGQSALMDAREQLAVAEKTSSVLPADHSATASAIKEAEATSAHLLVETSALTLHIQTLQEKADARSGLSDFTLRIRRAFGRGRGQKTRTEYREEIRSQTAVLDKLKTSQKQADGQAQQLRKSLAAEISTAKQHVTQQEMRLATLKANLATIEKQQVAHRENLKTAVHARQSVLESTLEQQKAEAHAASRPEEHAQNQDLRVMDSIEQLEKTNARLLSISQENLLHSGYFEKLCNDLPPSTQLARLRQQRTELLDERSPHGREHQAISDQNLFIHHCQTLKDKLDRTPETVDEHELSRMIVALQERGIHKFGMSPELRHELLEAGHLYALQCVDKILAHPLTESVAKAENAAPRALALLSSLEKEVNNIKATRTQLSLKAIAVGAQGESMPQEIVPDVFLEQKKESMAALIKGLQRIIKQDHAQALTIAADFNDQRYSEHIDGYIDRQHAHGTCIMHSWNNVMAYLSDNQVMQMTPWRMEKLIQGEITQSAHQILEELLNNFPRQNNFLTANAIDAALSKILRSSELVAANKLSDLLHNGFALEYETRGENIRGSSSNLHHMSIRYFELLGMRGDNLAITADVFHRDNSDTDMQNRLLNEIVAKQYDAFDITFSGPESAHALALIRSGENFALVDSNHAEPIMLSLPQLVDFIRTGKSDSDDVNAQLMTRTYNQKYVAVKFNGAFYKEQRT